MIEGGLHLTIRSINKIFQFLLIDSIELEITEK